MVRIGGWKIIRKGKVYGDEPERIYLNNYSKKAVYLWDLYSNKRLHPSQRYAVTVQKYDPQRSYGLGKILIRKYFKTKTQALKFALNWMKKHPY